MNKKMFYSVLGWTATTVLTSGAAMVYAEGGSIIHVEPVIERFLNQVESYDFCTDAEGSEYATKVVFQVDEPVTDFRYSSFQVDFSDEGQILMQDKQELFYAESYSPEQFFVAELEFMEFMPNHCVEFLDMENAYHCYLLSESGEDGSPILSEYETIPGESSGQESNKSEGSGEEDKSVTLSFEANETTGYIWTGFVIGGHSVELENELGSYEVDDNPEMLDGVGGTTYFQLNPVAPGQSIVRFDYARSWEEGHDKRVVILADVDEDLNLTTTDITFSCMDVGTVTDVDEENHSVTYVSDSGDEVIATFDEELALPVMDEEICVYTTGIMTMSIPPIVNVLAWETLPSEYGRTEEWDLIELSLDEIVEEMCFDMKELTADETYLKLLTTSDSILEKAAAFSETCGTEPVKIQELAMYPDEFLEASGVTDDDLEKMSNTGYRMLIQRYESASVYASMLASKNGAEDVAATTITLVNRIFYADAPAGIYIVSFENGSAMILDVKNETPGITSVTAHMVSDLSGLDEIPGIEVIDIE